MPITSFRDLRVWQGAMDLVVDVYKVAARYPKQELYALANQTQRAAVSIPSNIAEGHAREHTGEYLNHLSIAQGSLAELETQVELAWRLAYIDETEYKRLNIQAASVGKQLYALRNSLQKAASR